jgi:hypothetical protein
MMHGPMNIKKYVDTLYRDTQYNIRIC